MPHVDGWYCILLPRMDGLCAFNFGDEYPVAMYLMLINGE